ncbi:MAG: hypothetical protein KOO69_01760 [Victivallales bacterium]|nr:hypothetical protein [Victivallales bacterium]
MINFKTVKTPDDFHLFSYRDGKLESQHYDAEKRLIGTQERDFYAEIFVDLSVSIDSLFDREQVLLRGVTKEGGWELLINLYGYLLLREIGGTEPVAITPMPLSNFANTNTIRLGFVMSNPAYYYRRLFWAGELYPYCRINLLWAPGTDAAFRELCDFPLENKSLCPVPERVEFPEPENLLSVSAYNTCRKQIFEMTNDSGGVTADADFQDASRFFSFWNARQDTLNIFTGPEFVRSDSYWLFGHISGAEPGKTKIRVNTLYGYRRKAPAMTARFFWSTDRETWQECPMIEPVDEAGCYYPLLTAPAETFYLSTSIPFLTREKDALLEKVESLKFVETSVIGQSVDDNDIHLLKITDPSVPDEGKKHAAFIIGQHSPMEMMAAHFIIPMLEYLQKNPEVLKKCVFYCVPTVNVDCAKWGSDGLNLNKLNTNRCWFEDIQPETQCIMKYFDFLPYDISLFVDFHAGSGWKNHTLLRMSPDFLKERFGKKSESLVEKYKDFNLLLGKHAGIRYQDGIDHEFRNCCAKDWFKVKYPDAVSCDLELASCSWFDPRDQKTKAVTQDSFDLIGKGIIKAMEAFLA